MTSPSTRRQSGTHGQAQGAQDPHVESAAYCQKVGSALLDSVSTFATLLGPKELQLARGLSQYDPDGSVPKGAMFLRDIQENISNYNNSSEVLFDIGACLCQLDDERTKMIFNLVKCYWQILPSKFDELNASIQPFVGTARGLFHFVQYAAGVAYEAPDLYVDQVGFHRLAELWKALISSKLNTMGLMGASRDQWITFVRLNDKNGLEVFKSVLKDALLRLSSERKGKGRAEQGHPTWEINYPPRSLPPSSSLPLSSSLPPSSPVIDLDSEEEERNKDEVERMAAMVRTEEEDGITFVEIRNGVEGSVESGDAGSVHRQPSDFDTDASTSLRNSGLEEDRASRPDASISLSLSSSSSDPSQVTEEDAPSPASRNLSDPNSSTSSPSLSSLSGNASIASTPSSQASPISISSAADTSLDASPQEVKPPLLTLSKNQQKKAKKQSSKNRSVAPNDAQSDQSISPDPRPFKKPRHRTRPVVAADQPPLIADGPSALQPEPAVASLEVSDFVLPSSRYHPTLSLNSEPPVPSSPICVASPNGKKRKSDVAGIPASASSASSSSSTVPSTKKSKPTSSNSTSSNSSNLNASGRHQQTSRSLPSGSATAARGSNTIPVASSYGSREQNHALIAIAASPEKWETSEKVLTLRLQDTETSLRVSQASLSNLQARYVSLEKVCTVHVDEIYTLQNTLKARTDPLSELKAELASCRTDLASATLLNTDLQTSNDALTTLVEESRTSIGSLERDVIKYLSSNSIHCNKHREEVNQHIITKAALANANNLNVKHTATKQRLRRKVVALKGKISSAKVTFG
ncbi:hypothetical protein BDY24DRAFT_386053 [Mrakia frigida]|uniref:uncharacterized protein n=1 Tax=Mrakia frigida TaxID=29902 RepID=UPI003FCBF5FC